MITLTIPSASAVRLPAGATCSSSLERRRGGACGTAPAARRRAVAALRQVNVGAGFGSEALAVLPTFRAPPRGHVVRVLATKHCEEPGCDKPATHGEAGLGIKTHCAMHKTEAMVEIHGHKKCAEHGCEAPPLWGTPGGDAEYCSYHKKEGMVNLIEHPAHR